MNKTTEKIIDATIKAINQDLGFSLPKEDLSECWLRYSNEVPKHLRRSISEQIYNKINVRVLWISGTEVNIQFYG